MAAPSRFPNGITNTGKETPMGSLIVPDPTKVITYFNDFHTYASSDWTVTETDAAATQAATSASGGVLALTHDGSGTSTAVNQLQLGVNGGTVTESFKLSTSKRFWMKTRFAATAGTMANFGILIGLAITDTSAVGGVTDGLYIRKSTGSSALEAVLGLNSTETSITIAAAPGLVTATYYEVGLYYNGKDEVEVWLDGVKVGSTTTLTNLCTDEELSVTIASVNATAAAANVLSVDYLYLALER